MGETHKVAPIKNIIYVMFNPPKPDVAGSAVTELAPNAIGVHNDPVQRSIKLSPAAENV